MYYNTCSTEEAIQVIGGVMPGGYTTVRLGDGAPMGWKYEFRMEEAKKALGLEPLEKMTLILAREYIYLQLDTEDLPEPVKKWRKEQEKIKEEMNEFNSFMEDVHSGNIKQPTLVAKVKKYFPSITITKKMKIKDIVELL